MDCPFCDVSVIERQKIWETEQEIVLYNIRPANKGQCLVAPKRHVTSIHDLPDDEVKSLFQTVKRVAGKLKQYLNPTGFNYGFNEGSYAGQSVMHLHFHVLPRFEGDAVMRHHLFHRKKEDKRNLTLEELTSLGMFSILNFFDPL